MADPLLVAILASEPQGLRFGELAVRVPTTLVREALSEELTQAIAQQVVSLHYDPTGTGYDDLRFQAAQGTAQAASEDVLTAVLKRVREHLDQRGDFTNSEDLATLYPALLRRFSVSEIDAAVTQLIGDAVLALHGYGAKHYLSVWAPDVCWQTVLAHDAAGLLLGFHVRAGNLRVAEQKVKRAVPAAKVLASMPGVVQPYAAGSAEALPVSRL